MAEISGWGAAVAGGIGAQTITLDTFKSIGTPKTVEYIPQIDDAVREAEMSKWHSAVQRARGWSQH